MRMSPEGERATGSRIQDQPDRALPHWLNPLGWAVLCSGLYCRHSNNQSGSVASAVMVMMLVNFAAQA